MKNIHLLPTDKPSRLYLNGFQRLLLDAETENGDDPSFTNQHIYITNSEEIREGDWFIQVNTSKRIKHHSKNGLLLQPQSFDKKIILTTDEELIKDGVQSIDNEFLEWFVKNPSCERVEIKIEPMFPMYSTFIESIDNPPFYGNLKRKIIIPKEEPKQETLEEVAVRLYPIKGEYFDKEFYMVKRLAFIDGAKWQAERMYSEGEVLQLLLRLQQTESYDNLYDWFEQFKKK